MTKKVEIPFNHYQVIDFIGEGKQESVKKAIFESLKHIDDLLMDYYFKKRGKVHSIIIDEQSFSFSQNSGTVSVFYKVNYNHGCQDIHYDVEEKMLLTWMIDSQKQVIIISGEPVYERDGEEF